MTPRKIFLAGAAGVIGRRLVPLLHQAGHRVFGTTRSVARAEMLRALGAHPVVVDVFDLAALRDVVGAARRTSSSTSSPICPGTSILHSWERRCRATPVSARKEPATW